MILGLFCYGNVVIALLWILVTLPNSVSLVDCTHQARHSIELVLIVVDIITTLEAFSGNYACFPSIIVFST